MEGHSLAAAKTTARSSSKLKELGIERAALRAFRRMAASEMIENGVAPSVVQRQMRHSDSRITLQKYAHVMGDAPRHKEEKLTITFHRNSLTILGKLPLR